MTIKDLFGVAGVTVFGVGLLCIPAGLGTSPKRDLSRFFNLADMGLFWKWGAALVVIGLVLIVISMMLPDDGE